MERQIHNLTHVKSKNVDLIEAESIISGSLRLGRVEKGGRMWKVWSMNIKLQLHRRNKF
jgi:hypothetical protein